VGVQPKLISNKAPRRLEPKPTWCFVWYEFWLHTHVGFVVLTDVNVLYITLIV